MRIRRRKGEVKLLFLVKTVKILTEDRVSKMVSFSSDSDHMEVKLRDLEESINIKHCKYHGTWPPHRILPSTDPTRTSLNEFYRTQDRLLAARGRDGFPDLANIDLLVLCIVNVYHCYSKAFTLFQ